MGASYLVMAGDPEGSTPHRADLVAAGWREAAAPAAGVGVWTRGPRPPRLARAGDGIWTLGDVWAREGHGRVGAPSDLKDHVDRIHGVYVAVHVRPGGRCEVLRGPSGALDALAWRSGELACVADDLEGVPPGLWPADVALSWDEVAGFFRQPASVWGRCALEGVAAIGPGDILDLSDSPLRPRPAWRPAWFARHRAAAPDPAALVRTVTRCVADAAGGHDRLLLEVSGGLDSAIVVTSLSAAGLGPRVALAVNQFAGEAESDERDLAAEVCARARVPLRCVQKPVARLEAADLTALADGARPTPQATDLIRDRLLVQVAEEVSATAILTGQGGDLVFYQMASPLIVSDLVRARGLMAAWGPEARATARWLRRSLWSMPWRPRLRPADLADNAFRSWLGPRALGLLDLPAHPWLDEIDDLPPGKQLQIAALCGAQMKHGRSLRGEVLALRHPLLSQPVVEHCLAIPSWRLTEGRDRGFARRAFAGRLPPRVATRRSKGALSTLYAKRVAQSLDLLRPWLLDGLLCAQEVLDRAALERALTPEALLWEGQASRLASAAVIEGWARSWEAGAGTRRTRPNASFTYAKAALGGDAAASIMPTASGQRHGFGEAGAD